MKKNIHPVVVKKAQRIKVIPEQPTLPPKPNPHFEMLTAYLCKVELLLMRYPNGDFPEKEEQEIIFLEQKFPNKTDAAAWLNYMIQSQGSMWVCLAGFTKNKKRSAQFMRHANLLYSWQDKLLNAVKLSMDARKLKKLNGDEWTFEIVKGCLVHKPNWKGKKNGKGKYEFGAITYAAATPTNTAPAKSGADARSE